MQDSKIRVDYPSGDTFEVDRHEILRLDARKVEIPTVTRATGAELMRAMELGYSIAGKLLATVTLEASRMEEALAQRAAVVILDEVPRILQEKGLATPRTPNGSEDQRSRILTLDKTHSQLKDCVAQLEAIKALLKIDLQAFAMAFSAIKKTVETQFLGGSLSAGQSDSSQYISRGSSPTPARRDYQDVELSTDIGVPIGTARI